MTSTREPLFGDGGGRHLAPRGRDERSNRARREPCDHRVGAAGEDDGRLCARHDAGGIRTGEKRQTLGEQIAGFEVRNDQHVGMPRHAIGRKYL
jgi:hypothetical protein